MVVVLGLAATLLLAQRRSTGEAVLDQNVTATIAAANAALASPAPPPLSDAERAAAKERAERDRAEREQRAWQDKLADDRWVHPLPGPKRRMPLRLSRVFGAERPGHRPSECQEGHCGVDVGGEVWGEPILASHDGVAVRVNRDPSRSGGRYVRLSHRKGTVFTQYFHLAAIPTPLTVGKKVRAGEVIGLLGDTGIVASRPHLHFTVSVKQSPTGAEQFIDPEPLIALWPVAVPVFGDVGSIARTHLVPGHPKGPFRKKRKKRRPRITAPSPVVQTPASAVEPAPAPAPAPSATATSAATTAGPTP